MAPGLMRLLSQSQPAMLLIFWYKIPGTRRYRRRKTGGRRIEYKV
jgi:hypothetical protein